jgi:hypothetical protein
VGDFYALALFQNGVTVIDGPADVCWNGGMPIALHPMLACSIFAQAGDRLAVAHTATSDMVGYPGLSQAYCTFDYLGSV